MTADRLAEIEQRVQAATPTGRMCPRTWTGVSRCRGGLEIYLYGGSSSTGPAAWRPTGNLCRYCAGTGVATSAPDVANAELIAHAPSDLAWAAQRIRELEAREARVRELHQPMNNGVCRMCLCTYPCTTIRVLDGES